MSRQNGILFGPRSQQYVQQIMGTSIGPGPKRDHWASSHIWAFWFLVVVPPIMSFNSLILIKYFRGLGDYFSRRGEMITLRGHS